MFLQTTALITAFLEAKMRDAKTSVALYGFVAKFAQGDC
jgi:hypothetical protein